MKNIFKQILIPCILIACLIFLAAYGTKINFGESWFKDSLPNGIVPNKSIRMQPNDSLYYNGVVVTSGTGGGGIAASDNTTFSGNNTFTNGNTFSDSLRADGYTLISDANITTNLRVTGDVITDLNFLKGSSTSIGTISTDSLAIITNNTKRIVIDKNGYITITDTAYFSDHVTIIGNLNAASNIYTSGNLTADSIAGIGTYLTSVDAITLKGQDTTHFARTDTLTTETNKAQNIFSDVATFWKTVTFTVSPIFSALVDFANGLSTTTLTASSTATFNGDVISNGWTEQGGKIAIDRYYRDTVLRIACTTVPVTLSVAHGISDIKRIVFLTCTIRDDSSGIVVTPGTTVSLSSGFNVNAPWVDATNVNIRMSTTNVNLDENVDTIKYYIRYTDYNR